MIKIYNYGEVPNSEIFARDKISANVEDIVADIISEVRRNGDEGGAYGSRSYKIRN